MNCGARSCPPAFLPRNRQATLSLPREIGGWQRWKELVFSISHLPGLLASPHPPSDRKRRATGETLHAATALAGLHSALSAERVDNSVDAARGLGGPRSGASERIGNGHRLLEAVGAFALRAVQALLRGARHAQELEPQLLRAAVVDLDGMRRLV